MISFFTLEQFHGKYGVGSTRLRVHQLIKYWPQAEIYRYGTNPEALIFQKVYLSEDYRFPEHFEGIKILDICDPDWTDGLLVAETARMVDGVTVPSEALAEFMRQLTDKPVRVIPDRHDLENFKGIKHHRGKIEKAVWFGYQQNAELLKYSIPTLERRGIHLTVISNEDPFVSRYAKDVDTFGYKFVKFDEKTLNDQLKQADICVLPIGGRPKDRFKSNNRTIIAQLNGLPVVSDVDMLDAMETPEARNKQAKECYNSAKKLYDVRLSVQEMKDFIEELKNG